MLINRSVGVYREDGGQSVRMKTEELIQKLHDHSRSTEVLLLFNEGSPTHWKDAAVYGESFKLVIGEWDSLRPQLQAQKDQLRNLRLVCPQRQSAWPLLAIQDLPCRIEPGAWIRDAVEIEDNVLIGANAVILEGVRVGQSAVVAAGAVVTEDVPPGWLAAGIPARLIKRKDKQTREKTEIVEKLRDSSR